MKEYVRFALIVPFLVVASCSSDVTSASDTSVAGPSTLFGKPPKSPQTGLQLDGIDDYADIASATIFNGSALTVEAWVRLETDVGPTQARIVNRQSSQSGIDGWGLQIFGSGYPGSRSTGNEVAFHSNNCVAAKNLETGVNLQKRQWYHLAAVNDGTTLRVYVDGRLAGTTSSLGAPCPSLAAPIVIGKTGPLPAFFFPGPIDEIRIWNVARPALLIVANIRSPLTGHEPGLVGYWPLDEGAGTTTADATGGGHDGTLRNGAGWAKHKMNGRGPDPDDDIDP